MSSDLVDKRVPPEASSKRPLRRISAPVKEPFSCPKSSLAAISSGRAAALNEMNTSLARGPAVNGWPALQAPCPHRFAEDERGGVAAGHSFQISSKTFRIRPGIADNVGGPETVLEFTFRRRFSSCNHGPPLPPTGAGAQLGDQRTDDGKAGEPSGQRGGRL